MSVDRKVSKDKVLINLPTEILVNIFKHVPVYSKADLAMICKTMAVMAEEHDVLWCDPVETDWMNHIDTLTSPDCGTCQATRSNFQTRPESAAYQHCPDRTWLVPWELPIGWLRLARNRAKKVGVELSRAALLAVAYEATCRSVLIAHLVKQADYRSARIIVLGIGSHCSAQEVADVVAKKLEVMRSRAVLKEMGESLK